MILWKLAKNLSTGLLNPVCKSLKKIETKKETKNIRKDFRDDGDGPSGR